MSAFVLDTSIAMKWFLEDEDDRSYSLAVLGFITDEFRPVVPWLWYYEVANNLLVQVRRKRLEFEKLSLYLATLDEMAIDVDEPDSSAILQLPYLARQYNLTSYDAAFLELAMRLHLPIASNDQALMRAAAQCGIERLPAPAGS
jgi:predicted nucleic acid-binding protein